jgi:hypothetical protein
MLKTPIKGLFASSSMRANPRQRQEDHYGWHHAVGKRMKDIIGNEHFGDIYVIGGVEIRCAEDGGIFQLWKGQLHGEKVDRAYDPKEQHY